jgi:predicted lipoprotein with Yx(FWY)xxD motif
MRRIRLAVLGAAAALAAVAALGGCSDNNSGGGSSYGSSSPSATTGSPNASPAAPAALDTQNAGSLGTVLVDGDGRTLYLFEADKSTESTCKGGCATAWPPLLTSGKTSVGGSAQSKLLGTTKRSDGTTQVTYNGHPLYTYAGDAKPGDANGQALDQFGALWYVLDASGNKITKT